jgi:hypothetical protein
VSEHQERLILDLSYKVFDPKSNAQESKDMVVEKIKGEMNTKLSLRTECEESVAQFEIEISYGEMLVLQRLLDVR